MQVWETAATCSCTFTTGSGELAQSPAGFTTDPERGQGELSSRPVAGLLPLLLLLLLLLMTPSTATWHIPPGSWCSGGQSSSYQPPLQLHPCQIFAILTAATIFGPKKIQISRQHRTNSFPSVFTFHPVVEQAMGPKFTY